MDLFNTTENTNSSEQETPIFSLSASIKGIELQCNISQLNLLAASAEGASHDAETYLLDIRNEFKKAYDKITPMFEKLLAGIFGDEEIQSHSVADVSESTIFFIGGE